MTVNPLVIIILTFGAVLGYGFARLQLKGRFIMAQEAIEDAETEIAASRYREECRVDQLQRWKEEVVREFGLSMSTAGCPEGISASQILGYNDFGVIHPSQYPGGKSAWLDEN